MGQFSVGANRVGQNVHAATKSNAKQIEVAARNGNKDGILQHKGHELKDGSVGDPHFQTEGVAGHTFWSKGGALPELLEALSIPVLLTPSSLAPGTLYGPGTQFPTQEAFDNANGSPGEGGGAGGFKGVFRVNGRIDSKALDKELSQ